MNSIVEIKKFLNKEECDSILDFSLNNLQLSKGLVGLNKNNTTHTSRNSDVAFYSYNEKFNWLIQRINTILNKFIQIPGFDVDTIDNLQFTKYDVGQYYEWHSDTFPNNIKFNRAYSVVIQLSDNYEGGLLQYKQKEIKTFTKGIGNLFIFPSTTNHRVTPVTRGVRYSLVGWFGLIKNGNKQNLL